jgi:hypothetical protein
MCMRSVPNRRCLHESTNEGGATDEDIKAIAANIGEQRDRPQLAVTPIPPRQPKAQLTESLHLVLSRMSDREMARNGWRDVGTDLA